MKINKFNENTYSTTQFIENFSDNLGDNIPSWISEISKNTKLGKYNTISIDNTGSSKRTVKFAQINNLPNLEKYAQTEISILKLEKQIEKLKEKQENELYLKASDELLYKFQEELLEKDFENFYRLFLEPMIIDKKEYPEIDIYEDIHPKILKNKKFKNIIDLTIDARKYNL